jgi:hypothetical protein
VQKVGARVEPGEEVQELVVLVMVTQVVAVQEGATPAGEVQEVAVPVGEVQEAGVLVGEEQEVGARVEAGEAVWVVAMVGPDALEPKVVAE